MSNLYNSILLIDDDESLNKVIAYQLGQMGYKITTATNGKNGIEKFKQGDFDILISDLQLPGINGMEILKTIRQFDKQVIIIIITAFGTVENAIEACHLGADDYLTKPFGKETLRFTIEKAIKLHKLQRENIQLRSELYKNYDFGNLIGKSAAMEDVLKLAGRVAESDATVLIQGESGTGKELIARAIHYNSRRKDKPFIIVNCPSIPDTLIESELFGHVKGAFTGASRDRKGKFQLAHEGSIFLDEIGDLKEDLQAKLLRVLQEKEIERVGDSSPTRIDVRIIAASNKKLEQLVQEGRFREDLYYRLNVVAILIPPLRDRKQDIPFLVDYFIKKYSKDKKFIITNEAMELFAAYDWPGNVRELENSIERAIVVSTDSIITKETLPATIKPASAQKYQLAEKIDIDNLTLEEIERLAIIEALKKSNGNQTKAAKMLDIPRHVLLYRMKKLGIH